MENCEDDETRKTDWKSVSDSDEEPENKSLSQGQERCQDAGMDRNSEQKIAHLIGIDLVIDCVTVCEYCRREPCLLKQGLMEVMARENERIQSDNEIQVLSVEELRKRLFHSVMRWIGSRLGDGRKCLGRFNELPICIRDEILELCNQHAW